MTRLEFKKIRQQLGHTHKSLAEALGVHWNTINKWEMGVHRIPKVVQTLLGTLKNHETF